MIRMTVDERRARRARHALTSAARATTATDAARRVVALHSTDPASVFLLIRARTGPVTVAAIEAALYEQRSLLRMLGMRRTMFVVADELAAVVHASSTAAIAVTQRKRYTSAAHRGGGRATVPGCASSRRRPSAPWSTKVRPPARSCRPPSHGCAHRSCWPRARPTGRAERHDLGAVPAWRPTADRARAAAAAAGPAVSTMVAGGAVPGRQLPCRRPTGPSRAGPAVAARVRSGHAADLKWWTGWTGGQVKQALAAVGAVEVDSTARRVYCPDDTAPQAAGAVGRPAAGLDPTPMGWQERSWYLGPHGQACFTTGTGNVGPTVWCDGRIVGGWAHRSDGSVAYRLLEDIGTAATKAVQKGRPRRWPNGSSGPVRVTPGFRTPLRARIRRLSAQHSWGEMQHFIAGESFHSRDKCRKGHTWWCGPFWKVSGGVLLSHSLSVAVPSALKGLTSGFGMGPGVSLSLWPP